MANTGPRWFRMSRGARREWNRIGADRRCHAARWRGRYTLITVQRPVERVAPVPRLV